MNQPVLRRPTRRTRPSRLPLAAAALCLLAALPAARAADIHRKVPGGTLTYTVELAGQTETGKAGTQHYSLSRIHRHYEATVRLHGKVANGTADPIAQDSPLDRMQKAAEACGEDQACLMRVALGMRGEQDALKSQMGKMAGVVGRATVWTPDQKAACHAVGRVDDSQELAEVDTGEGYAQSFHDRGTLKGEQRIDCAHGVSEYDGPRLFADPAKKTYELTLPPFEIAATATSDAAGFETHEKRVRCPQIKLTGLPLGDLRASQTGRKELPALFTEDGPVFSAAPSVEVRAVVTWTFRPDAR
jgi:hypothetical protein